MHRNAPVPWQLQSMAGRPILPLLVPLFLVRLGLPLDDCQFRTTVDRFRNVGGIREVFFRQQTPESQSPIFKELTDSAIDFSGEDGHFFGFPYYLKITLHCTRQDSVRAMRKAHYSGLLPIVTVAFEEPVHSVRQKPENLLVQMKAAPYRVQENCDSEEVCKMWWYTPMPIMNGSVVMLVTVTTNNLGFPIPKRSSFMNINGYVKETKFDYQFTIGERMTSLKDYMSLSDKSRPLMFTFKKSPVLILGGFPKDKAVLISDTGFEDYFLLEVSIDSCWISSPKCPWGDFSSSIEDAIATESTLFVRQNQLVYYFTGYYSALHLKTSGSELWTRILAKTCVRKLNPVSFTWNDTEYVIAIGGGSHEGLFFLISVKDGIVKPVVSKRRSVCSVMERPCEIVWVIFTPETNSFFVLVQTNLEGNSSAYSVLRYHEDLKYYEVLSAVPQFIPESNDQGFVLLIGQEEYTDIPMVPRGISYSPFSSLFYVWGNMVMESKDFKLYLYLSGFPSHLFIKYFVLSFVGQYAFVTDDEQVWISHEGSAVVRQIYPSGAWNVFRNLQILSGSRNPAVQESLVTVFFDWEDHLKELVYTVDAHGNSKLIKRELPVRFVLAYRFQTEYPAQSILDKDKDYILFSQPCPFDRVRLVELSLPQRFDRKELYHVNPPEVMEKTGFHDKNSLAVFQGVVSELLFLHSAYNRPYADPVHDPTWRWWKKNTEDVQYFSYLASNRKSSGGIFVDLGDFSKVHTLPPGNVLAESIYLDKNNAYHFTVFLSARSKEETLGDSTEENPLQNVWMAIIVAHPEYVNVVLQRREMISRGAVLYRVSVTDTGVYPRHDRSGKNLLKSMMIFSVCNAIGNCYDHMPDGPSLRGYKVLPVLIGCPPGKRLAFDITGTLERTTKENKRYFDCVYPDPEMPCFFFSDVFYPSFLVQDMVTGESGPFSGSFTFKIIGGGPYSEENIRYFSEDEILRYNTNRVSNTEGHIWLRESLDDNATDEDGFQILTGAKSGIVWVCREKSACYDILPRDMLAPHYFFVIHVSNRGVDRSTYCDYALEFTVHVHGLQLSPTRAIYFMKVCMSSVCGMVVAYVILYIVAPLIQVLYFKAKQQIRETVLKSESSATYSSSGLSGSSHSNLPSTSTTSAHSWAMHRPNTN